MYHFVSKGWKVIQFPRCPKDYDSQLPEALLCNEHILQPAVIQNANTIGRNMAKLFVKVGSKPKLKSPACLPRTSCAWSAGKMRVLSSGNSRPGGFIQGPAHPRSELTSSLLLLILSYSY